MSLTHLEAEDLRELVEDIGKSAVAMEREIEELRRENAELHAELRGRDEKDGEAATALWADPRVRV